VAIYHVHPRFLPDIWEEIEADVSRACEHHPFLDSKDVRRLIEVGHATLFIATKGGQIMGFCALEVVQYPSRTVCNVLGIGGKRGFLAMVDELIPMVLDFGKSQGATVIALSGRPGWLRALRHTGGRSQRFITMWADIDEQWRRINQDNHDSMGSSAAVPAGLDGSRADAF
jgi:hypothetical protein